MRVVCKERDEAMPGRMRSGLRQRHFAACDRRGLSVNHLTTIITINGNRHKARGFWLLWLSRKSCCLLCPHQRATEGLPCTGADRHRRQGPRGGDPTGLHQSFAVGLHAGRDQGDRPAAVRLGMRLVRGLPEQDAARIAVARGDDPFVSIDDMWRRAGGSSTSLITLAEADAFRPSLKRERRYALWSKPLRFNCRQTLRTP